jgi:hypothetical protein
LSGAQTIATTLTVWLIVTGLGFAACSTQAPPLPGDPKVRAEPLVLADTKLIRAEVLTDDAAYRLEQKCLSEGGKPYALATFVHCERGGPSRAGWMYSVSDVPDWRRGVK